LPFAFAVLAFDFLGWLERTIQMAKGPSADGSKGKDENNEEIKRCPRRMT
jgi:hypothetical protein